MAEKEIQQSSYLWDKFSRSDPEKKLLILLRGIPIFEGLSRSDLKAVERILHRRKYHAGEYVFREGDPGLGMYIVEKGEISIVRESRSTEIARLGSGDFFGEMALFNDRPRNASAVAYEDTKLFGFFQPDLFSLLETRPRIGVKVVAKLAGILAERLYKGSVENARLMSELARKDAR
jgi:CRP-like cAMP-binding protein